MIASNTVLTQITPVQVCRQTWSRDADVDDAEGVVAWLRGGGELSIGVLLNILLQWATGCNAVLGVPARRGRAVLRLLRRRRPSVAGRSGARVEPVPRGRLAIALHAAHRCMQPVRAWGIS